MPCTSVRIRSASPKLRCCIAARSHLRQPLQHFLNLPLQGRAGCSSLFGLIQVKHRAVVVRIDDMILLQTRIDQLQQTRSLKFIAPPMDFIAQLREFCGRQRFGARCFVDELRPRDRNSAR